MYCEALFAHGYFNESLQFANILSANLINNQPNLLLSIGVTDLQLMKSNEDETAERKSNDKLIAKVYLTKIVCFHLNFSLFPLFHTPFGSLIFVASSVLIQFGALKPVKFTLIRPLHVSVVLILV